MNPGAPTASRIRQNLADVRERMAAAATRAGRPTEGIMLVGITKYVEPPIVRLLVEAGLRNLGESRPQELWSKAEVLADLPIAWHLVGHLQRNKVRRTLPLITCLHSADSLRLLEEINREAVAIGRSVNVLLEINVSGDVTKHGFQADEIEPLLPQIAALSKVQIIGLMAMAALAGGAERARLDFATLRRLRDRLSPLCPPNISLRELSMGMSGDFEVAVEEGATIVRVGTALFDGVTG